MIDACIVIIQIRSKFGNGKSDLVHENLLNFFVLFSFTKSLLSVSIQDIYYYNPISVAQFNVSIPLYSNDK